MNFKLLLAISALLVAGGLQAYGVKLINHTSMVVGVQFPTSFSVDPQIETINPNATAEYHSGAKMLQGVRITSIMLPSGRVIGGSTKNTALKETFSGRACGFTWHLFAEEKTKPTVRGNTYVSTPEAIKFYLLREPCGIANAYPGGLITETEWLNPATGEALSGQHKK